MRRSTGLLLLLACTLPRFFVNGFEALQPLIKNNASRTDAMIRGLLDSRQFFCQSGFSSCDDEFCCPINWVCCFGQDGCCQPSMYCALGSNGVVGCCPDGEVCSGPAGPPTPISNPSPPPPTTNNPPPSPTTINPPPPPPTTTTPPPPPPMPQITINSLPPPPTTTVTTLLGGPTQSFENAIIDVPVFDINFSENWVLQTSSCDPSIFSMITSTGNSFFTYISSDIVTVLSVGYLYYINVVNSNTEWEVFVNGVSQNTYFSYSSGFTDCTYVNSSNLIHALPNVSQNITVVAIGSDSEIMDRSSTSDSWSLEVNMMLIQDQISLSGSTSSSSAGRTQPYRPLQVTGGILLAAVISILRL